MDTGSHLGRDHMNHRITKSFKLGKTFKIVTSDRIIGKILLLIANFTEINVMKSNTTSREVAWIKVQRRIVVFLKPRRV